MADDMQTNSSTIRTIIWRELFPFTNIFRAFRIAIHPAKLFLALVALVLVFSAGSLLDYCWPVKHRAVKNEVALFEANHTNMQGFQRARRVERENAEIAYAELLLRYKLAKDPDSAMSDARAGRQQKELKRDILKTRDEQVGYILKNNTINPRDAVKAAYQNASDDYVRVLAIKNYGLFDEFFEYESAQVSRVVRSVGKNHWLGSGGVIDSIVNFLAMGPLWLATQHQVFFVVFAAMFLTVWAVFGGAIARIAAVLVARDEKISVRSALRFSFSKLLSFLFAPIIPLLIILVIGLVVWAGSLALGNWPGFGPILLGLFFFLALAAGFVMALVLVGLVGGFNLMYPTIAVEGSDSFDAISRSFSYLYARPWRLAFYTAVAVAYGAITYLFVRLFIFLLLVLSNWFVAQGVFKEADNGEQLINVMWPSPVSHPRLTYDIDTLTLGRGQMIGAYLIEFWVYLLVSMLGAFAISFYFSSNTIIYYLMRREVDATEMDDVYLEQSEEDFNDAPDPATEATRVTPEPAAAPPAPPTPPAASEGPAA